MSKALDYLLAVRKEVLEDYFNFFKKAGHHLDPKTRALLSVLTKVAAQTETGFKQYLMRALDAGNQADEILDALLVCMPILGFAKIVWAVDIIIQMDIPQFHLAELGYEGSWHQAVMVDELNEGLARIECDGKAFFVYKDGDSIMVYHSRCPHRNMDIPMQCLTDNKLVCPQHGWQFDITNGACVNRDNQSLNIIQHKLEAQKMMLFW